MTAPDPFAAGLARFVDSLVHREDGGARPRTEVEALLAATRAMLNRLAQGQTPDETKPGGEPLGAAFRTGQTVAGVFTVTALLNRGGMGEVYRARHRHLGTDHALKVLQPDWAADPHAAGLLRNEARLLLAVRHDAVVGGQGLLLDDDGRPVLVMDYLHGRSLARLLHHGPIPVPDVVVLGTRLLAGLGALHARGIVHGDLSPGNIMLCDEQPGGATLIDLGVARLLSELGGVHAGLEFAGKPGWAAPEQLDPAAAADTRSDLYGLGLVLAAAASGAAADGNQGRHPPSLAAVPAPLHPVLTALLQHRPAARPVDAAAAAALLAMVQPVEPPGFFSKWMGS